jgi:formylglycine-generating enzyme required for sulfatase activity
MLRFLMSVVFFTLMLVSAAQADQVFRDCTDCPEMVSIPAGSFVMGSPVSERGRGSGEIQHQVTISKPFAVSKFEITRKQFDLYMKDSGDTKAKPCNTGDEAVGCIKWDDAQGYALWLKRKTGQPYRLLSEAEWEYAARAGTTTIYYWGNDNRLACRYANVKDRSWRSANSNFPAMSFPCNDGYAEVAPVGKYVPNAFGLYDMLGNVWEWTEDCWNQNYNGAPSDGSAWKTGDCDSHVLRGGAWGGEPLDVRAAERDWFGSSYRIYYGIRVAKSL